MCIRDSLIDILDQIDALMRDKTCHDPDQHLVRVLPQAHILLQMCFVDRFTFNRFCCKVSVERAVRLGIIADCIDAV